MMIPVIAKAEQMGLRGERPWGTPVSIDHDTKTAVLQIVSECVGTLHPYRRGDKVECFRDDRNLWVPVNERGNSEE